MTTAIDTVAGVVPDERFVSQVSSLHWTLQTRAKAALLKSDNPEAALALIIEGWTSPDPDHRRHVHRVSQAWAAEYRDHGHEKTDSETLADALRTLDDDHTWWIRCQLPSGVAELTETEDRARHAIADFWREISHG